MITAAAPRTRTLTVLAAVVAGAIALRLLYGPATMGFDAVWALVWGDQLAHGGPLVLDTAGAPTPHPLAIAVSALVTPLGDHALDAILALAWLSWAALGALAFALGRELHSTWVGVAFAALLLTRPQFVLETQQALIDVPFVALVLGAMLVTARRGREGYGAPLLLALAGLLRPEGWLLAIAWAAWAWPERQDRAQLAALALAAPVIWAAQDLLATGDPLFSLHTTRDLAASLARPRGLDEALRLAPRSLRATLTDPVIWLGLAGAAVALTRRYAESALPAAVAGLGLFTFLVLGVAGLPVLVRYLLLPATMLALWCAVLVAGWWRPAGVAALVVLGLTAGSQLHAIQAARGIAAARGPVSEDLEGILREPATRAALAACRRLSVPDSRARPLAAWVLDRPPSSIAVRASGGVMLSYASEAAARAYRIGPESPPASGRRVSANRSWIVSADC